MKKFIVLILALNMYLGVFAQFTSGDTLKYRISLKDKAATDYSLQKPEKYLSIKSISFIFSINPLYNYKSNFHTPYTIL